MCWNFETSIVSFGIGLVTSIALLIRHRRDKIRYKNDIILVYLILTYSIVQLAEALMWKDLNCARKLGAFDLNKTGSYLAYLSLAAHPLAIAVGIYQAYKQTFPLVIGLILFAYWLVIIPKKMKCSQPQKDSNGHLVWGFETQLYILNFAIAMGMTLYYIRPISYAAVILTFYVLTLVLSYFLSPGKAVGSNWCWMSAFLAPLAFVVTNFIK
jgi:hypothetical protein